MPIKADLSSDDAISASSLLNLNGKNNNNHQSQNTNPSIKLQSTATDGFVSRFDGGEQQITVACRLRPLTQEEILDGSTIISHKIAEDNMIVLMDPMEDPDDILRANRSRERTFVFDMVFDSKSTQQDVYEKTTKSLLPGVLNGYNATVFAYGATGAGKTYTMLGTQEEPGIMFRTLHDLFIEISKTSNELTYQVSMSYLEIYNELIRDLLNPSNGFLELREDAKGGVQVAGISELVAETPQEVMYLLHKGNKERTQEPTKANKTSSRSHAVLQVNIKQRNKVRSHTQEIRLGKLYMIDLAGSERAAQTQNTGKRMVEGAHINRSLLALGNCINALSEKGSTKYVNYRDSKLTRILKDSLGGNSKTVMIAHISPASIHFEESRNTLIYADRAKYIRTKLRRNVIDVSFHISQYQQIIQELAHEIASLKDQRSDLESRISLLDPRLTAISNEDKSKLEEALKLRESLLQSFKNQITLRKSILELENALMDISIEAERHTKIIETWETQKENDKSNRNGKSIDQSNETVLNAKEELKVVEQDREELELKRRDAVREFEQIRAKTQKLRDLATKKLTTQEQKEILNLLLKNFEFEIKNIEMQADIFKRDFKLREQDMVILRLEQHRSLCDTLISQQRRLIVDNNLIIPHDLDELYHFYTRDVHDGQLMKDLSGARSTSNSSFSTNSPKPAINAFLTQIEEEKADHSIYNKTPNNYNNNNNTRQSDHNNQIGLYQNPWSNNKLPALGSTYDKIDSDQNRIFLKTNKATQPPFNSSNKSNNNNNNKKQKDFMANGNFLTNNLNSQSSSSNNSSNYNNNNNKDKNNMSNVSSSTNDSNMEIIFENNTSTTNRNFISTASPNKTNGKNGLSNSGIPLTHIVPPGQVISNSNKVYVPNSKNNNIQNDTREAVLSESANDANARRLTQGIAAIAAQRKAYQHHLELMHELGQNNDALTLSRLAKHDQVNDKNDDFLEKKNSILTDGSNKPKKQVKIREIVQYKLPDDDSLLLMKQNNNANRLGPRTNSDSPILTKRSDELINNNNNKTNPRNKNNAPKRSKSNNQQNNANIQNKYQNQNQINSIPTTITTTTTTTNGNTNSNNNNNGTITTNSQIKSNQPKPPPSIPNYSKNLNMSVSGTSVLRG